MLGLDGLLKLLLGRVKPINVEMLLITAFDKHCTVYWHLISDKFPTCLARQVD